MTASALLTFGVGFIAYYTPIYFHNDHFVHLSRAQQILLGDLPIRDFFDPGMLLQYYVSAAALAVGGHNLLGEAILTSCFMAVGAALVFTLSARFANSYLIGVAAAILVIVLFPRAYSYPKAFLYVLGTAGAWLYAARPSNRRLLVLAVTVVTAFLFRHDHGVYLVVLVVATVTWRHWNQPDRGFATLARFGALVGLALLPFVVFVQFTVGLPRYVGASETPAQGLFRLYFNRLPIKIDRSRPWIAVMPAPEPARVSVAWNPGLDATERGNREVTFGLDQPRRIQDSTWSYLATDPRPETIRALVSNPDVIDTAGIERGRAVLEAEPFWTRLERRVPLLRAQILPGVRTHSNAVAWLYYVFLATPFASAGLLLIGIRAGRIPRPEAAVVGASTLLAFIIFQTLVRGSPDSRLEDVAGPLAILGAWCVGRGLGTVRLRRWRWLLGVAALSLWVVTVDAAAVQTDMARRLAVSGFWDGAEGVGERLRLVTHTLQQRPIDTWDYQAELGELTRYALECTVPTDRVLATLFAPHVFFFAERGFAGGQVYFHDGWHATAADQRVTIQRLERQRVPIVLTESSETGRLEAHFPDVHRYVMRRYTPPAAVLPADYPYAVRVDPRITPTGVYEPLSLPCYR